MTGMSGDSSPDRFQMRSWKPLDYSPSKDTTVTGATNLRTGEAWIRYPSSTYRTTARLPSVLENSSSPGADTRDTLQHVADRVWS